MTANPIPIVPLDTTSRHSRHYDFDSFSFSAPASTSSIVSPKSRSQYTATVAEVPSDSPPSPGGLARSQASLGDEDEAPRGRDASPRTLPYLHSPSISPVPLGRSRRSSHAKIIEAHHHLPSTAGGIPSDPVLYLPPLLSPLPHHVDKQEPHPHSHSHANAEVQKSIIASGGEQLTLTDFRTRLPNIDPASLALHQVLHHFRPVNNDYARTPYEAAFNWADLVSDTSITTKHPSFHLLSRGGVANDGIHHVLCDCHDNPLTTSTSPQTSRASGTASSSAPAATPSQAICLYTLPIVRRTRRQSGMAG